MAAPLPKEPMPGDPLDADWGRAVARALRSQRVSAGPGLRASQGPDGTTLSLAPGRGGGASYAGTVPLIATVRIGTGIRTANCQTLDGRSAGEQRVAAIELAGGPEPSGSARCIVYPVGTRIAYVGGGA